MWQEYSSEVASGTGCAPLEAVGCADMQPVVSSSNSNVFHFMLMCDWIPHVSFADNR